jgi:hypothetical protein
VQEKEKSPEQKKNNRSSKKLVKFKNLLNSNGECRLHIHIYSVAIYTIYTHIQL